MKQFTLIIFMFSSLNSIAQLNSGTPTVQKTTQPVPSATTTDKSATPQPVINAPAANPIPPVVPGGDVKAVEIPRQLVYPPSPVSGTQPVQKEPLSPIESTNILSPNRPQREESSRNNKIISYPKSEINSSTSIDIVPDTAISKAKKTVIKKPQASTIRNTKKVPATQSSKSKISSRF